MEENKLSRKEKNKQKVIDSALEIFVKKGIEHTTISEVAKLAGLTERSIFRYFTNKGDLILAAGLSFWHQLSLKVKSEVDDKLFGLSCFDQINLVLTRYAETFFTSKELLIFVEEAELYLARNKKTALEEYRLPSDLITSNAPLAKAIKLGVAQGLISNDMEKNQCLYYNCYDGLLGLLQKMALEEDLFTEKEFRERLNSFIKSIAKGFFNN